MAFAGIHVSASQVSTVGGAGPLPGNVIFGKTLAASGGLGQIPPSQSGNALLRAEVTVDGFVAISEIDAATALTKSADVNGMRRLVRPGAPYDFYVPPGAFIAWTTA